MNESITSSKPLTVVNTQGGAGLYGNVDTDGGDFVGRDKIIFNLVDGVEHLPILHEGLIKNFLVHYLGTDQHPVPFGGRDSDLLLLDQWWNDAAAMSFALLTAPAGRGKSTLLAHWVALMQKLGTPLVFFPISVRFNTNRDDIFFTSLLARVAHLHDERVPRSNDLQEYRSRLTDYLYRPLPNGKRMLLVVDGIDEAAGWEVGAGIFPLNLPTYLRVLVSARTRANDLGHHLWLSQLGWIETRTKFVELAPLGVEGVRDVLAKMGEPISPLAKRPEIVSMLYKLSKGDPLTVRLYVDQLLPNGTNLSAISPEQLQSLKPGLKAFFDRWFRDQKLLWRQEGIPAERDIAVNSILNLLAVAKGPVSREDLRALCPNEVPDTASLDWAVDTLQRFIIGNGDDGSGYVLSHTGLSDFFAGRMSETDKAIWSERFIHYGRTSLAKLNVVSEQATRISRHILYYYSAYLIEAKAEPAAFYALMSKGWLQAWRSQEGFVEGFVNDVERAWNAAKSDGMNGIGQAARAALCVASVASSTKDIDINLVIQAFHSGFLTLAQALALLRNKPDHLDRVISLAKFAKHCKNLLPHQVQAIRGEAFSYARAINDPISRTLAFCDALLYLPTDESTALLSEVLRFVDSLHDKRNYAKALSIISRHLSRKEAQIIVGRALQRVSEINDPVQRVTTVLSMIYYCDTKVTKKLEDKYWLWVRTIEDEDIRRAYQRGTMVESRVNTVDSLEEPVVTLSHSAIKDALSSVQSLNDHHTSLSALVAIIGTMPLDMRLPWLIKVLEATREVTNPYDKETILRDFIRIIPESEAELFLQALSAIRSIDHEADRLSLFCDAIQRCTLEPNVVEAGCLAVANSFSDSTNRYEAFFKLASKSLAMPTSIEAAESAYTEIESKKDYHSTSNRSRIALLCLRASNTSAAVPLLQAIRVARQIPSDIDSALALIEIATYAQGTLRQDLLSEVQEMVGTMSNRRLRLHCYPKLFEVLPIAEQHQILLHALAEIREIYDDYHQEFELKYIVPWLSIASLELCNEIIDVACQMYLREPRERAFILVVQSLPIDAEYLIQRVLPIVYMSIHTEENRVAALSAIASKLVGESRMRLFSEAFEIAETIEAKDERLEALTEIAKNIAADDIGICRQLLLKARKDDSDDLSISILTHIAPYWSTIFQDPKQASDELSDTLRYFALAGRKRLHEAIRALAPGFVEIGGANAALEIATAIMDTSMWWP